MINPGIFKSYDIRGIYPQDFNEEAAFNIGRSFVEYCNAKRVVVGYDVRLSFLELFKAVAKGVKAGGADVFII